MFRDEVERNILETGVALAGYSRSHEVEAAERHAQAALANIVLDTLERLAREMSPYGNGHTVAILLRRIDEVREIIKGNQL